MEKLPKGISQEDLDRLARKVEEMFDINEPVESVLGKFRYARCIYFKHLWQRIAMVIDGLISDTRYKGNLLTAEQQNELYQMQMHALVWATVFVALQQHALNNFTPGFLKAAEMSGLIDKSEVGWVYTKDFDKNTTMPDRSMQHITEVGRLVFGLLQEEQAGFLSAARRPDAILVCAGYVDPRTTGESWAPRSLAVNPMQMPAMPLNEVDFVEDVMLGLQRAEDRETPKGKANNFIANRILLNDIDIWRKNYFELKL